MTDRDDILRKIRALLLKTVANGCSMEEALAAHAKARKLIDEYEVSHEELYGAKPRQQQRAEPEPEAEPESERAAEETERAYSHNAKDLDFRSRTARLANALYRTFSGLAVALLLAAVVLSCFAWIDWYTDEQYDWYDAVAGITICILFGGGFVAAWLVGRAFHYVLGGDAYALWERALIARARHSPEFRKICGSVALLFVGGVAWLTLDGRHQEALRKQQYEQQRQAEERREAQREEVERLAAIAAQRAAAEREAVAEHAAVILATDLSFSNVTLRSRPTGTDVYGRPLTRDQMDELPILSGTITNYSGQTLRYLVIEMTLKDCTVGYGSDECKVVGQQIIKPTVNIPPNQTRTFNEGGLSLSLPQRDTRRQRFLSWRIITASSCSQENLSEHRCANKTAAE
ncbi:MAG TPA: DUF2786 domain-containing protein [Xanthobacteraceae bacterium]|jgi:hypothetical protein